MLHPNKFPRYKDFDPLVPVWCVTPERPGCIHRFFDTSPISPSGRYLALFQFPQEDRPPEPGEYGSICLVDLQTGQDSVLAQTCGWEPQLGANVNWGGSDEELFFNDVDTDRWKPFSWKLNPLSGERQRMEGTVYHASSDGSWLISANLGKLGKTQLGYGVALPEEQIRDNVGPVDDDGFYLTDTHTGKSNLLISIADILDRSHPSGGIKDPHGMEIYGFHSRFNPQGNCIMVSLRWFPRSKNRQWNMFQQDLKSVQFSLFTISLDGSDVHCVVGPDEWKKGGHHAGWYPDGKQISMNLKIDSDEMRFVRVGADGTGLCKILNNSIGSGHPTVHPNGRNLITDTYTWERFAYGDGTTPLRWVNLATGDEQNIIRIHSEQPVEDSVMRVDPHPAWDRSFRYITFNAFVGGTRRVFIADMQKLLF